MQKMMSQLQILFFIISDTLHKVEREIPAAGIPVLGNIPKIVNSGKYNFSELFCMLNYAKLSDLIR